MKPILKTVAIVGAAAALLAGCRENEHTEALAPRPVLSVAVGSQIEGAVVFAGTIEPRYKSDHSFQVLGRIISREVNVGSLVKKGQRLATLDPLTFQLAVRSAQADLAIATARRENAVATEVRQRTLLHQTVATQAQYEFCEGVPRDLGGQCHKRQGKPRQSEGAARLYGASCRL